MENSLFAFYGSLRRGMQNYAHYKEHLKYLFSARIKGYKLYSRGEYPCAVKTGTAEAIVVEVFRITDAATAQSIHDLELGVGYHLDHVTIDGERVAIYLFESPGNYQEVKGGDWVTFFRQRTI